MTRYAVHRANQVNPAPSGTATSAGCLDVASYPVRVANDLHLLHITCGGCVGSWAGQDRAHCSHCHVTYDSITLYDAHRADGRCARPQALGLVPTKNGIWRQPGAGHRQTG
jgi:hypothetical protein